jgi:hypothetical protein
MAKKKPVEELPEPPPIPTILKVVDELSPEDRIVLNGRAHQVRALAWVGTWGWSTLGGKAGTYENPVESDQMAVVYTLFDGGEATAIHKQQSGTEIPVVAPG